MSPAIKITAAVTVANVLSGTIVVPLILPMLPDHPFAVTGAVIGLGILFTYVAVRIAL